MVVQTRSKKSRTRSGKVFAKKQPEKKSANVSRARGAKPAIKAVVQKLNPESISVGELVYGKIAGFAPWPAFIKEIFFERSFIFLVEFLGDRTEAYLSIENLQKFVGNEAIGSAHKHKKGYAKAFNEAERLLDDATM